MKDIAGVDLGSSEGGEYDRGELLVEFPGRRLLAGEPTHGVGGPGLVWWVQSGTVYFGRVQNDTARAYRAKLPEHMGQHEAVGEAMGDVEMGS